MFSRLVILSLGFIQLLILANKFGAGIQTDAYFIASSIFFLLISGMEGTFTATFIPIFIEYREKKGEKEAWAMARNLIHIIFLCSLLISLIFYLLAPHIAFILAPGLPHEARALCGKIMRLLSPLGILFPLNALLTAIYYSYQRFAITALTSIFPLLGGVSLLIFLSDSLGIMALPLGLTTFSAIQLVFLSSGLGSKIKGLFQVSLNLHEGAKKIGRLAPPRFLGFSLMRLDLMIDRFFASLIGVGFVTAITYSGKVPSLTAGMITSPLMKSLVPFISKLSAHKENETIAGIVTEGLKTITILLMPLGVFLILFGSEIIAAVFEHGAFAVQATELTAYALFFYSFGIIFYGLNPLLRSVFFVLQDTVTPLKIGVLASGLNIVLNLVLIQFLSLGGIALATSLVALFSTAALCLLLEKKIGRLKNADITRSLIRPLGAALLMGVIINYLKDTFSGGSIHNNFLHLGFLMLIGMFLYLGFCLVLKVKIFEWKQSPALQKLI